MRPKPPKPARGWPRRYRWLLVTGFVLGFFSGVYFLFQNQIVDAQLRPILESELAKAVKGPVSIGSIRGGLTGNVVLDHVALTIPGNPWETRLAIERISVRLELFNLIFKRKPPENCLEGLFVTQPNITLVRVEPSPGTTGSATITAISSAGVSAPLPLIPVPKISVSQGSFSIQADKTPREILTNLNFDASTENGTVWGLVFQAHSPEANSIGILRFNGSLHLSMLKIAGKVLLEKWPLASVHSVLKELAGWELQSGTIDAESAVVFQPDRGLWFDAKTDLAHASIRSPLPTSITLSQINGRAYIRPTEISVPGEVTFLLGETPWTASGLIPFDNRPLSVRTKTDQLYLSSVFSEILKLKDLKVDGKGTATLAVAGPMANPVIQGVAELGPSHVGKGSLDSLRVKAGYEKGNFRLYEANGKLYDGDFQANGFMSLSGEKNAPVSLKAVLKNIDAKKLATDLGISGMEGRGDVDVHFNGSLENPSLSAVSEMTLSRTLRNSIVHYSVHTNLQMTDQKRILSAVIDEKAKLETEVLNKGDDWEIQKFQFTSGKKSGKVIGRGKWSKKDEGPIDIQVQGKGILLQGLPFFADQFPDITGSVNLDTQVSGTWKEPRASAHISSEEVDIKDQDAEPLEVSLSWNPKELNFEKLTYGEKFSTTGTLGLSPESSLNLDIQAQDFPIQVIAPLYGWENPPQPFEGNLTGHVHISGVKKNPIVEGTDGIVITALKAGDWYADQVEAVSKFDQGKLLIKKVKLIQGTHTFTATGYWNTQLTPGVMSLHFSAKDFQLGKGPFLSGDFLWEAKTGEPFLENWTGTFSSGSITLSGLEEKQLHFNDFFMAATSEDYVIKGKVKIGKTMSGSATLDLASSPAKIQALLKIEPVILTQATELTQFLPAFIKVSGKISGELRLKNGTFDELPMEGNFNVNDGTIQKYNFDRMAFNFLGDKKKIVGNWTLARDQAKYSLSGALESPKAFWDSDSRVTINGPFKNEKLQNLLALLGISADKHKVTGEVNGNLTVSGALKSPSVGFAATGESLQYDNYRVSSANLNFTESEGKVFLGKNRIELTKGEVNIEKGSAELDPQDPTVVVLDLVGSTQSVPIASVFDLTSLIRLSGRLALEEKENRPTFDGMLSYLDTRQEETPEKKKPSMEELLVALEKLRDFDFSGTNQNSKSKKFPLNLVPFDLAIQVHKKTIEFKPMDNEKTQLVGRLDFSQSQKIIFENIHLENSKGLFSVDGTLDLNGTSHFVSDAQNIPIEEVGKWLLPKFPLSGTGSYHLIFDGTLDSPVFTTSISVTNGKIGDLQFDLLDGQPKSKEGVLSLGTKDDPMILSHKGLFSFNIWGTAPLAFTEAGLVKVHNREMDINAQMDKGDFGLILLAGLAKKASGEMDFSAHVGGTLDNPDVTMDLDLNHCQMVPTLVAQSIEDISGRIKIRNNHLAVEDLNGRIGQGRVFISSPPIEESKMVLVDFVPNYLDFRVQTIGDHGLWLSIPTLMDKGEWGEIYFYGENPKEPMLIRGPLTEPHVIGTALLDSGHYTFPPKVATDDSGEKVEYRELAGVFFELKLAAGKNIWYSNDFNGNYLNLKVNPGDEITLTGKDSDRTPEEAGIKCYGSAGSKEGWLRYFGHEFKLEEASLFMTKGKPPTMQGHATDRFPGADVVSAGGVRKTDVDVWVDFKGTFGNINFTFDSNPRFSTTDPDMAQKILLSNIIFGRDMTGLSREDLRQAYEQNALGGITNAGLAAAENLANAWLTQKVQPLTQPLGIGEVDIKEHILSAGSNATASSGTSQILPDAFGNTLSGGSVPIAQVKIRKSIGNKLSLENTLGVTRDLNTGSAGVQEQFGINYDVTKNLSVNATTGQRDDGQFETKGLISSHWTLPDIMGPKKGDKVAPRFERFDIYPIGAGKFSLVWVTDKVTKSEIKIFDADGNLVQDIPEKKQHDYRHQMIVENLNPEKEYKIQISVKDLNENETVNSQKVSPSAS